MTKLLEWLFTPKGVSPVVLILIWFYILILLLKK